MSARGFSPRTLAALLGLTMTGQMGYFSYRLSETGQQVQRLKRMESQSQKDAMKVQSPAALRTTQVVNDYVMARERMENNIVSYSAVGAGLAAQAALGGPQLRALWALLAVPAVGLGYWVYGRDRKIDFDVSTAKNALDRVDKQLENEVAREELIESARNAK